MGCQRTPFANHLRGGQPFGQNVPSMGTFPPFATNLLPHGVVQPAPTPRRPEFSNTTKQYANWNVCFTCGFDVEEGHTSATCPIEWRKPNHQENFNCANAQQYITAGYKPCQKGMHKNVLPAYP